MTTTPTLERLAAATPVTAEDTRAAMSIEERELLLQSIVSSPWSAPKPLRNVTRFLRSRLPAVAVSTAAAVVFATFGFVISRPGEEGSGPLSRPPAAPVDSPSVVLDKVRLAVASAEARILHVRTDLGIGVLWDAWFDGSSDRSRSVSSTPQGEPMYDHEFRRDEHGSWIRVVSHGDRAWWEYAHDRPITHGWSPEDIRAHLDRGTLVEVAREHKNGKEELHLRWAPENAPHGTRLRPGDLWVDAATYLPIRSAANDRGRAVTMHFEWMERSPENLRFLEAPVPSGFRRLDGPPAESPGGAGLG